MTRALMVLALSLFALPLSAASGGKASGKFVVGARTTTLKHAWVVEKNKLMKIVLSSASLADAALFDDAVLQAAVGSGNLSALVIHLDEDGQADSTFFFHQELPAGLEVRRVGTFKAGPVREGMLSGRVVMDDDGFSFSYDATFEAPVLLQLQQIKPLAADATPRDHALWRLEQMETPFDEGHFRSVVLDGDADAVELFLTAGMPVGTSNAIYEAVSGGKADVVKLLLKHGADENAKDTFGQSLVMTAVSNHHNAVLTLLIGAGADVSTPNQYRITPLAVAAEQGHLDMISTLLAAGAKINARDTSGGTALSVAILRGYTEIVAALLEAGADVQRDRDDLLALAAEKPAILAMLEKAMKK